MSAWSAQSGLVNAAVIAAFGQPVSYQPAVGAAFTALGIFAKTTDEERLAAGVYAQLFMQRSDCPAELSQGDVATVAGVAYTVFAIQIDTAGGVRLSLHA